MRVPVYDSPQVGAAALPAVRQALNFENGLGAVGQGVAQLGRGVQHAVDVQDEATRRAQHEADVAASTKAITDWQNRAVDVEHGTADGKTPGFYSLQGDAAVAQSAPTLEQLAKAQKEIAKGLANDTQRQLFLGHTSGLMVGHRKAVEDYTSRQIQVVQAQRAKALTDSAVRAAGANYADDSMAADAEETARAALFAQMVGDPEEAKQAALDGLRQRMTSARLDGAIQDENLGEAERLLTERGAQLGTAKAKYEHQVATLKAKALGEKNAQALSMFALDPDSGLVDIVKFDQGRNATPETARTPEFEHAAEAERSQAIRQNTATKASAFQAAYTAYERSGGNLNAVPAEVKSWLVAHDGKAWEDMKAIARRDAARRGGASSGGSGSDGDPAELAALNELRYEMAKDPEKFASMSPAELARDWAPRLSPAGFKKAGALHAKVVAAAQRPDKEVRLPTLVQGSVINAAAHAFGEVNPKTKRPLSPTQWKPDHHQLLDQVLNDVQEQDAMYRKAHGGQGAPAEQLEKWARDQLVKGRVKGSGFFGLFGDEETAVEARAKGDVLLDENGQEIGAPPAPAAPAQPTVSAAGLNLDESSGVPAMDRALIQAAFRNKGKPPPTEEQIRAIYARRQGAAQ